MTKFLHNISGGLVGRTLLVISAAALVGLAHYFVTDSDIVVSLQFAGAAAWGAVIMDIGKDIVSYLSRR